MNNERHAGQLGKFLCSYATTLLECGATTVRIEKNVERMAKAYGSNAEISIYPRHVEVVLMDDDNGRTSLCSKAISGSHINFSTVTALSFLVFTLLYTPCVAAISAVKRELGSGWKAVGVALSQCVIAWAVSFLVYRIALLLV